MDYNDVEQKPTIGCHFRWTMPQHHPNAVAVGEQGEPEVEVQFVAV